MKSIRQAALAIVVILCAGCHGASEPTGSEVRPAGAMSYLGYDDAGHLVVDGWIELDIEPIASHSFSGRWKLEALADPSRIGPQNGSGVLSGSIVEGGVLVDLHPDQADDTIQLQGTLTAGGPASMRYEGSWRWITFAGVRAEGTFQSSE